jgi:hypothetical protein
MRSTKLRDVQRKITPAALIQIMPSICAKISLDRAHQRFTNKQMYAMDQGFIIDTSTTSKTALYIGYSRTRIQARTVSVRQLPGPALEQGARCRASEAGTGYVRGMLKIISRFADSDRSALFDAEARRYREPDGHGRVRCSAGLPSVWSSI